jgi:hypothetical protein
MNDKNMLARFLSAIWCIILSGRELAMAVIELVAMLVMEFVVSG